MNYISTKLSIKCIVCSCVCVARGLRMALVSCRIVNHIPPEWIPWYLRSSKIFFKFDVLAHQSFDGGCRYILCRKGFHNIRRRSLCILGKPHILGKPIQFHVLFHGLFVSRIDFLPIQIVEIVLFFTTPPTQPRLRIERSGPKTVTKSSAQDIILCR